jgi:hypothetical protein
MKNLRETYEQFWEWFQANADRLAHFEADQEAIFEELSDELHKVHRKLTFEFGPETGAGGREFIVSADGNRALFPFVQGLVAAAPELPGWKILAFRQRKETDGLSLRMGDLELDPKTVWFKAKREQGKVALTLYLDGLTPKNKDSLSRAALILLDTALGEYDVEMKVGPLEFKPLPADPAARGLHPFKELPQQVDTLTGR